MLNGLFPMVWDTGGVFVLAIVRPSVLDVVLLCHYVAPETFYSCAWLVLLLGISLRLDGQ